MVTMKKYMEGLNNPWVLDLTGRYQKQVEKFHGSVEELLGFYESNFGFVKIPYDGTRRWGMDSSTETSDISYDDIDEGMELWMRKYIKESYKWLLIRVSHKYGGIIFFDVINRKKVERSYIDCGACDYDYKWRDESMRYKLPKHTFYPIELVKPSYIDIESWNAPKQMKIINVG